MICHYFTKTEIIYLVLVPNIFPDKLEHFRCCHWRRIISMILARTRVPKYHGDLGVPTNEHVSGLRNKTM